VKACIFLDRDGTIIEEVGYLQEPQNLHIIKGAAQAIRLLNEENLLVVMITNQSGIERGYYSENMLKEIHLELFDQLAIREAHIDAIYYCPHHPDINCNCRKPKVGMIDQAVERFGIDLQSSWVIGDKSSDIAAGKYVGSNTVLVLTGYGKWTQDQMTEDRVLADYVCQDLLEAVRMILNI